MGPQGYTDDEWTINRSDQIAPKKQQLREFTKAIMARWRLIYLFEHSIFKQWHSLTVVRLHNNKIKVNTRKNAK